MAKPGGRADNFQVYGNAMPIDANQQCR